MPVRPAVRGVLALVAVSGLICGGAGVAAAAAPDGQVTVTTDRHCNGGYVDVTVANRTAGPAEVLITRGFELGARDGEPLIFRPIRLAAGGVETRRLQPLPGPVESPIVEWHFWLGPVAEGVPLAGVTVLPCPIRVDFTIRVRSGVPSTPIEVCPALGFGQPRHGTARRAGRFDSGISYTSDRGYAGPDTFNYSCAGAFAQFGTVSITVLPGPAGRARPVPPARQAQSQPPRAATPPRATLPATGTPVGAELMVGAGLVGFGMVGVLLGRRRRCGAIR